jgi:hypothetical protein
MAYATRAKPMNKENKTLESVFAVNDSELYEE